MSTVVYDGVGPNGRFRSLRHLRGGVPQGTSLPLREESHKISHLRLRGGVPQVQVAGAGRVPTEKPTLSQGTSWM